MAVHPILTAAVVFTATFGGLYVPATAQEAVPDLNTEIISTAEELREVEVPGSNVIVVAGTSLQDSKVNDYISSMLQPTAIGQESVYARLNVPLCPSVLGLSKDIEQAIEARIRNVAAVVGIETDDKVDCKPSMHLMIVDDGRNVIRQLRKKQPRKSFASVPLTERDKIELGEGPVYSWNLLAGVNPITGQPAPAGALIVEDGTQVPRYNFIPVATRLTVPVLIEFANTVVLIETAAIEGLTTDQIADFALMRALIPLRDGHAEGITAQNSILGLFDDQNNAAGRLASLTRMDMALLGALYQTSNTVSADRQRGRMTARFREIMHELE